MPADYTNEVVKYLRHKNASGFDSISWLGAEQRFVGGLRNSGVNNLEEQLILGTDTYTVTYEDEDENTIIEKYFCVTDTSPEDTTNYYKLVSKIFKEVQEQDDFTFGTDSFNVNVEDAFAFGGSAQYPGANNLYGTNYHLSKVIEDDLLINPGTAFTVREDKLYYVKENEPDLLVLTKTTSVKYTFEGQRVVHEKITNSLNPSS